MAVSAREIALWREAHQNPKGQNIYVPEEALATVAPFPSLYAQDFAAYIERIGVEPSVLQFVIDVRRELAWAYDNWAKAQRDAKPGTLLDDMLNAASSVSGNDGTVNYDQVRRFIADYAKANGIALTGEPSRPAWLDALDAKVSGTVSADPILP